MERATGLDLRLSVLGKPARCFFAIVGHRLPTFGMRAELQTVGKTSQIRADGIFNFAETMGI